MQTRSITASTSSRFQMEWLLLISGLLLAGLIIGASLYQEYVDIGRREHDRLSIQAGVIKKSLSRALNTIDRTLTGIRDDLPAWQAEKNGMGRASHRLRAFADAMRSVRTFLVLDAEGTAIAANWPQLLGENYSSRTYFQAALKQPDINRLYLSPPFLTSLGVWSINVVRMIAGPNGEFAGVVSATLDPEDLRAELGAVLYASDMWVSLAHSDGLQILMEPERLEQAGKNLAQPGSFFSRHMASGQTAEVLEGVVAATGEHRLMALDTVRPTDVPMDKSLVVAVSRDVKMLYATWRQRAWIEGGLLVLLFGLSLPILMLSQQRRQRIEAISGRAAAALAESERFMRSLIDIIPGMVGYWNTELRCGFANIAYREWFGKTLEEIRGMPVQELMNEDVLRESEPFMRAALAGEYQRFERTLSKADGSTVYSWVYYIPDVADGQIQGFFVLVTDVSAIKQVQVQLEVANASLEKRSVEAEAASRAKSAFVANMSHEIRTPMNAVLGLLQLLELSKLDGRQLDYVHKAQGAAQSLLGILNDILDFSKVEAGKLTLDNTPFRLDELLRNLSVVLASALQRKEVEVLFQLDPGIPRALCGDGMRLQQILLNLAGNAIKFTEHGEVVIALKLLADDPETVRIEFSVRDTGIGIPADVLPRLFNAFEQADIATTRRFGGTGLGLAICRRLVHLMGGELLVESVSGQGSRFHFSVSFRRDEETRTLECAATEEYATPHVLRVLIVDDNATAREVLTAMATSFGWQAEAAASGPQALERLRAAQASGQPFDILCVDWIMPGMDGWEVIQHMRAGHAGRLPAILMITAHSRGLIEEQLAEQAQALDGFLVKPVTPSMLFDAVAQATRGESVTAERRVGERSGDTGRPLTGLHLLLVEDNALNQQVARELLAHAGAEVEVASNGRQGIECVKNAATPFNVILMDIQMPGMDGYTATRILQTEMGVKTPIIAMTANALPADREACLAAGMCDHVAKPIDNHQLIERLLWHWRGEVAGQHVSSFAPPHQLPNLPEGFDLASALARIDGNFELFASFARRFGRDRKNIVARTTAALHRGDRVAAAREMHTLKGLAATLGAQTLTELAVSAESVFRGAASDDDERSLTELASGLDNAATVLLGAADVLDPPNASLESRPTDPERILEYLDELDALLAERNMRALDIFATLKREAGSTLAESLLALDEAMYKLDFAAAREKTANLKAILER